MSKETKIDYSKKETKDYEKLSQMLYFYHSGMSINEESISVIAQATPEERIQAMNLKLLKEVSNCQHYGDFPENYHEELGKALFFLYYGNRDSLTKEQLLIISTASDKEKLEALESFLRVNFTNLNSSIMSMDLAMEEHRVHHK